MAKLDKSQGFTFVYTDVYKLYRDQQKNLSQPLAVDRKPAFVQPMGVIEAEEKALKKKLKQASTDPMAQLKQSLNSLTKAHAKLRFLLQEVDATTKRSSSGSR